MVPIPVFLTQLLSEASAISNFKMGCGSKRAKNKCNTMMERPSASPASTTRKSVNRVKFFWPQATSVEEQVFH